MNLKQWKVLNVTLKETGIIFIENKLMTQNSDDAMIQIEWLNNRTLKTGRTAS